MFIVLALLRSPEFTLRLLEGSSHSAANFESREQPNSSTGTWTDPNVFCYHGNTGSLVVTPKGMGEGFLVPNVQEKFYSAASQCRIFSM